MAKTRGGIYYNLKKSEYFVEVTKYNLRFYFSSLLYQQKFSEGYKEYIEKEMEYLKYRYNILNRDDIIEEEYLMCIEAGLLFQYYKKIEKRGEHFEIIN